MMTKILFTLFFAMTMSVTQGFVPTKPPSPSVNVRPPPINALVTPMTLTLRLPSSKLQMAEESEESKERRKTQQLGAAAVLLFGILYDFFVTHHGVGFWDPNYIP